MGSKWMMAVPRAVAIVCPCTTPGRDEPIATSRFSSSSLTRKNLKSIVYVRQDKTTFSRCLEAHQLTLPLQCLAWRRRSCTCCSTPAWHTRTPRTVQIAGCHIEKLLIKQETYIEAQLWAAIRWPTTLFHCGLYGLTLLRIVVVKLKWTSWVPVR